jgi:sucrose-6-phosphate hydrolase SacC (GH32 family)
LAAFVLQGVDLLMLDCGGKTGKSVIGPSSSTVSLRVFLDKSSIEAYAAGGRGVASHRVYPTAAELKQGGIALVNSGEGAVTMSGAAWPMAEATRPSVEELLLR